MPEQTGYLYKKPGSDEAKGWLKAAREKLEWGQTFRRERRETTWRRNERQWEGKHWSVGDHIEDPTADLITVNISFSTGATLVPYVTGSDPKFLIKPYSRDATLMGARAQQAWINRWWRSHVSGARRTTEAAASDNIVYGDGYGKVSWTLRPIDEEQPDGENIAEIFIDRIDVWNLWVDPMAEGLHNARWVCERIYTTLEELEADDTLRNVEELALGLPDITDDEERRSRMPRTDGAVDEHSWVVIYEFWDRVNNRLIVFGETGDRPLKVVEGIKVFPIVNLPNHWLPNQPYHMGDLEQIWSLQQELNKSRSQMLTHRKRNIPKFLALVDALDDEAEEALMSDVVNEMVPIKGDRPLGDIIQPVGLTPLTPDHYNVSDLIRSDVFEVTGVNEYIRGAAPQIRRTATEASIIEGASNVKTQHKLRKVEEFTRSLGRIVLDVAADIFPLSSYDELSMFITGEDAEILNKMDLGTRLQSFAGAGADDDILAREAAASQFQGGTILTPGAEIFTGSYEIEVVQHSTELRDPIFKEQKYREMAVQLINLAPGLMQMGVELDLRKVLELWFDAAEVQDVDSMFKTAPQPMPGAAPPGPESTGFSPSPGQPNPGAAQPPTDLLSALNTGALPPEGA